MAAISARAENGEGKDDFIGQVLVKGSPILTWRPNKVQRITPAPVVEVPEGSDSSIRLSFSRATTKRMVSWPVVPHVQSPNGRALRAFGTLVAFSLLCGSALTLCVYLLLGESSVAAGHAAAATRVATNHAVAKPGPDTLAAAAPVAEPPAAPAPPARRPARPQPRSSAAHGHKGAPARAVRSAHRTGGTRHRAI